MIWLLWTILVAQLCGINCNISCKVPGLLCNVTTEECNYIPSKSGDSADVISSVVQLDIDPYQKTDIQKKYYPGLTVRIVKHLSRSDSGVQLSYTSSNGTERCVTMFARDDSLITGNEITFSLDLYPIGDGFQHAVFRAYAYHGNRRSRTYAEQRVSVQRRSPAPDPENSSNWTTTIVYQIDLQTRSVSCKFAYPPSSLNFTHFIVSLQKLVTVAGNRKNEPRKTKQEKLITFNHYTFTNIDDGLYRIIVLPWDVTQTLKMPATLRQRINSLCKFQGAPSKCEKSRTDIFEIKDGLLGSSRNPPNVIKPIQNQRRSTLYQNKSITPLPDTKPSTEYTTGISTDYVTKPIQNQRRSTLYQNKSITPLPDTKPSTEYTTGISTDYKPYTIENPENGEWKEDRMPYYITLGVNFAFFCVTIILVICCKHGKCPSRRSSEAPLKEHDIQNQNRKDSLLERASQHEDNITTKIVTPEYLIKSTYQAQYVDEIDGCDDSSMAVTIGGGLSAPPDPPGRKDTTVSEQTKKTMLLHVTEERMEELDTSGNTGFQKAYEYVGDEISL